MNRKNICERFDYARRMFDYQSSHTVPVSSSAELVRSPQDSLLSIIYAPDDRTGLPTGDLQYFVSDKANVDVKQFILNNLMSDVSAAKNVANPVGLSDDALLELARGSSESLDEYVMRMNHEIDTFKFFKDQLAKKKLQADVSPGSE